MTSPPPTNSRPAPTGRGRGRIPVFGRRAVLDALTSDDTDVETVLCVAHQPPDFRKALRDACRLAEVPLETVGRAEVSALSREPRHDQGVAAWVVLRNLHEVSGYLEQTRGRAARQPRRLLAFDGVTNPQNVGMMVRSACAAGFDGVLWPLVGSPWINGLVVKASAASLYACPILRCETLASGLAELAAGGYAIAGLVPSGGESLFAFAPPHRVVYVVGSETAGLAAQTRELVDHPLSIPMAGPVESLNVAVAASLVCFGAQLRGEGADGSD